MITTPKDKSTFFLLKRCFTKSFLTGNFFQQLSDGPQYEKQQKHFICCIISVIRNMIGKKQHTSPHRKESLIKTKEHWRGGGGEDLAEKFF